ncbi:30725_t:CDS:1, partial [Racocetra persica]
AYHHSKVSPNLTNNENSKIISEWWKNEDEIVKLQWEKLADQKKLEHMQLHPDYKYRPQTAKKQKKSQ